MSNRNHCFNPVVYKLLLSCGHEQLASAPVPVGSAYPCWSACDPQKAVPSTVTEVQVYEPEPGVGVVVMSGATAAEMRHASLTADVCNGALSTEEYNQYIYLIR